MHLPGWIWSWIYALTSRDTADWVDAQFYSLTYWVGWVYSTAYDCVTWLIQTGQHLITWTYNTLVKWVDWLIDTAKGWIEWLRDAGYALIQWLLSEVSKIWDWVKDTVWKAVQELIAWSTQFIDYVTKFFSDLWAEIKSIWNAVEVWVDDLWDALKALWNQFVDWVKEILDQVYTYIEGIYNQIMGQVLKWINELEVSLRAEIEAATEKLTTWINETIKTINENLARIYADIDKVSDFLFQAFEDALTLTEGLITHTFTKYGVTLLRTLLTQFLYTADDEDVARIEQMHISEEIDRNLAIMDQGEDSLWIDVEKDIDVALEAMDKDLDPPDLTINDALLPPGEKQERDSIQEQTRWWFESPPQGE